MTQNKEAFEPRHDEDSVCECKLYWPTIPLLPKLLGSETQKRFAIEIDGQLIDFGGRTSTYVKWVWLDGTECSIRGYIDDLDWMMMRSGSPVYMRKSTRWFTKDENELVLHVMTNISFRGTRIVYKSAENDLICTLNYGTEWKNGWVGKPMLFEVPRRYMSLLDLICGDLMARILLPSSLF
ncbi:hypothetical protein KS4_27380 [Poriferisphaera corsica]|uniref:Uncharacterized protein n=1 Tax=Poriferisphaera corsica TaxID=2528020 RepID=A0A517YWT6_9BACT|nr:hypothetical protein [Poriferisphaera corsica]QDU34667.1 hypothetical protein KS4_27380 [Poriferisphaera corsica]